MTHDVLMLILAAVPVGFLHTVMGPDHYIPFIALAKTRNWTMPKTILITTTCGIGHVLSAAILGVIGIALGITFSKFNFIESWRGEIAAWLLISFGFLYFIWGVRAAIKNKKHSHKHIHFFHRHIDDNTSYEHDHTHNHHGEHFHLHPHDHRQKVSPRNTTKELTPWILFIVFILGPCEPLIPLMMYPAIKGVMLYVILISLVFGITTIATMLFAVFTSLYGTRFLKKLNFWERYGHLTTGAIICGLGLGIKFLGL